MLRVQWTRGGQTFIEHFRSVHDAERFVAAAYRTGLAREWESWELLDVDGVVIDHK